MKLLENMENLGGSIQTAVQAMIEEMFGKEVDEDQVEEIVSKLKLSDILILDQAYTNDDKEAVADILGRELVEYSMGRAATSAASNRPQPGRAQAGQQPKKEPGTQNTVQTNRNYSGGVQNGVSTQNIDNEDDPDAMVQDNEPIKEGSGEQWNSRELVRALEDVAIDEEPDDPQGAAGLQMLANRINQSYPDSVDMSDIYELLREPQLRGISFEDVKYALQATGFLDFMEATTVKENDETMYLELANFADEWAYDNDLPFGSEHHGVNDIADEFAELGIDTRKLAIQWVKDQINDANSVWNINGYFGPERMDDEELAEEDSDENTYSVANVLGFLHTWNDKGKLDSEQLNQLKQMIRARSINGEISFDDLFGRLNRKGFDVNKFRQGLDHFVANYKFNENDEELQENIGLECEYCGTTSDVEECPRCETDYCMGCSVDMNGDCPHCGTEYNRIHSQESIQEQTNVVDMVAWLKRRAGIS